MRATIIHSELIFDLMTLSVADFMYRELLFFVK